MKKQSAFDDQHQPMSSWLDKLATDETANFTDADLQEESVKEPKTAKYAGISSTWDTKRSIDRPMLDDSSRHVANRPVVLASVDQIEKEAKSLLMTGVNLEKVSTILSRRYSDVEMKRFATILPTLEGEFGKLGFIYVDASLVKSCDDIADMMKMSHKVASVAIRDVIHTAKCDDCTCNKKGACIKLGLNIVKASEIKTAAEAKSILNKFASLKYINSYFVKSSELTSYYNRLASGENPTKVTQDFLLDVNNRRASRQTDAKIARMTSTENPNDLPTKLANKELVVKIGSDDAEVATAFKQCLVKNPSIKYAKAELLKRYSSDRIEGYLKEAKAELKKFARFIQTKTIENNSRVSSASESSAATLLNKQSSVKIASATKMAYSLMTLANSIDSVKKTIYKTFGKEAASEVMSKVAVDKEAQFLGLTYIDSNLYATASEMKQVHDVLKRRAGNMIFQVKEGSACPANETGICATTGLKIVKAAGGDTRKQATRILNHARRQGFVSQFEVDHVAAKLGEKNNSSIIKAFVTGLTNKKALSDGTVKQITDTALKYAKDVGTIRRIAGAKWTTVKSLVSTLNDHVINKSAFSTDLKVVLDKTASDGNIYLKQANQYNADIFAADKDTVSDVTLGKML